MSARTLLAIILGATISSVAVYIVVRQFDVENADVIGGGVGGAVGAVIGQSLANKKKKD